MCRWLFKWHSKNAPFGIRTSFHYSKSELVRYSDPFCTARVKFDFCFVQQNVGSLLPGVDAAATAAVFAGCSCCFELLPLLLPAAVEGVTVVALLPFDITSGGTFGVGGETY